MTTPPPRRPWWRRKRTWAALLAWLLVAYPLSGWPIEYLGGRGWFPPGSRAQYAIATAYQPLMTVLGAPTGGWYGCVWYLDTSRYFYELGQRHAASD